MQISCDAYIAHGEISTVKPSGSRHNKETYNKEKQVEAAKGLQGKLRPAKAKCNDLMGFSVRVRKCVRVRASSEGEAITERSAWSPELSSAALAVRHAQKIPAPSPRVNRTGLIFCDCGQQRVSNKKCTSKPSIKCKSGVQVHLICVFQRWKAQAGT